MYQTDISTKAKYYDYVDHTVHCILTEKGNYPESEISELVFESVDSANIIIYTNYHMDILQNSNQEPQEWKHMVSENDSWQKVIQAMAFDVFRQDVWNKLHEKDIDF